MVDLYQKRTLIGDLDISFNEMLKDKQLKKQRLSNPQKITRQKLSEKYKDLSMSKTLSRIFLKNNELGLKIYKMLDKNNFFNYVFMFQEYLKITDDFILFLFEKLENNISDKELDNIISIFVYFLKQGVVINYISVFNNQGEDIINFTASKFTMVYNSLVLEKILNYYFLNCSDPLLINKETAKILFYQEPLYTLYLMDVDKEAKDNKHELINITNILSNKGSRRSIVMTDKEIKEAMKNFSHLLLETLFIDFQVDIYSLFSLDFVLLKIFEKDKYSTHSYNLNYIMFEQVINSIILGYSIFNLEYIPDLNMEFKMDQAFAKTINEKILKITKIINNNKELFDVASLGDIFNLDFLNLIYSKLNFIIDSYDYVYKGKRKLLSRLDENYQLFNNFKTSVLYQKGYKLLEVRNDNEFYNLAIQKSISPKWLYKLISTRPVLFFEKDHDVFIGFVNDFNKATVL